MDSGKILKFPNLLQGACNTYDCCPQIKTLLHKPRNPRALRLQEERRDFYPCLITSLAYLISDVASISIDRLNPASIRLKSKHRDLPFIYAPCSRVEASSQNDNAFGIWYVSTAPRPWHVMDEPRLFLRGHKAPLFCCHHGLMYLWFFPHTCFTSCTVYSLCFCLSLVRRLHHLGLSLPSCFHLFRPAGQFLLTSSNTCNTFFL